MKNTDLKINEDYVLMTDPSAHDFCVGDVTLQNQALILQSQKGEWKEHPMIGCGIEGMANDEDTNHWRRAIREQLQRDGMKVNRLEINNDNLEIDAEYENH